MSIKLEKPRFTKSKIAMALLLVATGLPTVGAAQDNVEVEEVVITGSNIRRRGVALRQVVVTFANHFEHVEGQVVEL